MVRSGKTMIRMPAALHEQLVAMAAEQGVSFNALMVTLLAGAVGFKLASHGGEGT